VGLGRCLGGFQAGQDLIGHIASPINLTVATLESRVLVGGQQHQMVAAVLRDGDRLDQGLVGELTEALADLRRGDFQGAHSDFPYFP